MRTIFRFLPAMLCGLVLTAAAEEKKDARKAAPAMPPAVVKVEPATSESLAVTREYIGHVEAAQEVSLQARISGVIVEQNFKEGSMVKAGDLLFVIEDTTYRAKTEIAKANLAEIQAELSYAESNYKRQETLAAKEATAQATFENAKRLIDLTNGRYAAAKATLMDAENELSYTRIHAPISGKIGKVTYTVGNYVSLSSKPLADIVMLDPVNVKFSISEREYLTLRADGVHTIKDRADIRVKLADGEPYTSDYEILLTDNKVDPNTGTISFWVSFRNPELKLTPGGYVSVAFAEKNAPVMTATSVSAIMTDNLGNFVYTVDDRNQVVMRRVKLGNLVGTRQLIAEGLAPGERVIVDGINKVFPGAAVKINE